MENEKRFVIRIPNWLFEMITRTAEQNRRSYNSEMLSIFETYFDADRLRVRLAELERKP